MKKTTCLECANDIKLDKENYRIGDVVECPFCGTELEVIELKENGDLVLDIIEEEK